MKPTSEQDLILTKVRETTSNLIITARAGTGKTSTLVLIAGELPKDRFHLALAFNKRMAEELTRKLPGNVKASTLNALGHQTLTLALGKRLTINTKKTEEIIGELFPGVDFKQRLRLRAITNAAKALGLCPGQGPEAAYGPLTFTEDGWPANHARLLHIFSLEDWEDTLTLANEEDEEIEEVAQRRMSPLQVMVNQILLRSIEQAAAKGLIDFADQLWLPTLFGLSFTPTSTLMVDEVQDLSLLNHEMLRLIPAKRVIAVGDPMQAIYAFRGAADDSMGLLAETFKMEGCKLTLSFRCPESIVANALQWVSDFRSARPGGSVTDEEITNIGDLPATATILCRNNAPLIGAATRCLRHGRRVTILGRDLEKTLKKTLKEIQAQSGRSISAKTSAWLKLKLTRKEGQPPIPKGRAAFFQDQHDTILALAGNLASDDPKVLEDYIIRLFSDESAPLLFSTGHKAKGMEWPLVYHLQPELTSNEPNIAYVIETRSSDRLIRTSTLK